jgi:putative transposase
MLHLWYLFGILAAEEFMPSRPRNFADLSYYHIYNRGNHKDSIYHDTRDYERFLWMVHDAAAEHGVTVGAYCLMPNHFHLLVQQQVGGSIQKCLTSLTLQYVKFYNKHYGQVGHLFQGKYGDRLVRDEADLLNLSRYIHWNPLGLGEIDRYEWSSYRAYLGEPSRFCVPALILDATRTSRHNYAMFCDPRKNSEFQGDQLTA